MNLMTSSIYFLSHICNKCMELIHEVTYHVQTCFLVQVLLNLESSSIWINTVAQWKKWLVLSIIKLKKIGQPEKILILISFPQFFQISVLHWKAILTHAQ
jgi:hypothetical protein